MIDIVYFLPLLFIVVLAIFIFFWLLNKRGLKAAIIGAVMVLVCGTFTLFALLLLWAVLYFSGTGH